MSVESSCFRLAFGYPDPPDCDCSFHDWTDRHSEAEGLDRGARRQLLPSFPPLFRRRQHARQGKDFCWKFNFIQGRTRTAFTLHSRKLEPFIIITRQSLPRRNVRRKSAPSAAELDGAGEDDPPLRRQRPPSPQRRVAGPGRTQVGGLLMSSTLRLGLVFHAGTWSSPPGAGSATLEFVPRVAEVGDGHFDNSIICNYRFFHFHPLGLCNAFTESVQSLPDLCLGSGLAGAWVSCRGPTRSLRARPPPMPLTAAEGARPPGRRMAASRRFGAVILKAIAIPHV